MVTLRVRIILDDDTLLGPGKVALLEAVAATGSISAAGRSLDMTFRRAWELIEQLNVAFHQPLVEGHSGGRAGGGAVLTPFGREVVQHYRAVEAKAQAAALPHLEALAAAIRPPTS
jgi:molybdate transport system regulatory protein